MLGLSLALVVAIAALILVSQNGGGGGCPYGHGSDTGTASSGTRGNDDDDDGRSSDKSSSRGDKDSSSSSHVHTYADASTITDARLSSFAWLEAQRSKCPLDDTFAFNDIIGELVRAVGHDFMSDFKVDNCLGLEHPENKGLQFGLSVFHNHSSDICPDHMSRSDCAVIISEAAMDFTAAAARPGVAAEGSDVLTAATRLAVVEEGMESPFAASIGAPGVLNWGTATGREDTPLGTCEAGMAAAMATHAGPEAILPNAGGGGPPVGIASTVNFAELHRVLGGGPGGAACDFTEDDVAAIMGVHTIGRARQGNSGFEGFWVDPRKRGECADGTFGCGPSLFDNQYYKDFFTMGWEKDTTDPNHPWRCIPGSTGVDIHSLNEERAPAPGSEVWGDKLEAEGACFEGSLRLPADMIVMFDLSESDTRCEWKEGAAGKVQSSCRLRAGWGEVLEYAEDDNAWLVSFIKAWRKMVDCSHGSLMAPTAGSLERTSAAAAARYAGGGLGTGGHGCAVACEAFAGATTGSGFAAPSGKCPHH
mmetsp:Transcript_42377/g.135730  ORF Transcript_42377/g.135730 Transcript_42377/m.135730 type:complete len:534 (-) Transcript_42377:199-1800(-)